MAKSYFAEPIVGSANYNLPQPMAREIGRIIVRWAYFEYGVQEMVWQVLDLSRAEGRLAVREPRVTDRLEMLRDLIEQRQAMWDCELFRSILTRAKPIAATRDLLAHGVWSHLSNYTDDWHVELTRGMWPKEHVDLVAGSRKVTPEGVPMNVDILRSTTSKIDELIEDLKKLRASASGPSRPSP